MNEEVVSLFLCAVEIEKSENKKNCIGRSSQLRMRNAELLERVEGMIRRIETINISNHGSTSRPSFVSRGSYSRASYDSAGASRV